ncbi:hypothetical protein ITI46_32610 [Streptomyces oryzae]|uniref:Uncharacterized protein n=1 Tax=Streptomyces oryzae TaxID=1434886 RepID=A0ABS3XLQ8_9ACTN|nr:hypothetical protein [Streptomyces oryzae]
MRAECTRLAELDDAEFGVRLLANTPTHEGRDPALLDRWAKAATAFGAELAADGGARGPGRHGSDVHGPGGDGPGSHQPGAHGHDRHGSGARVVERDGGLGQLLLARYVSRPAPAFELYVDTLALGEELAGWLGWRGWFPAGALREAALAHETAHCLLHGDRALRRALRERVGHTALRLGRLRVPGHVAGADELAAHGYAAARCGLGRTPLLLTAALASAARALGEISGAPLAGTSVGALGED